MPLLELDYVQYLSLVDVPAVEDSARYLVTKRHEPGGQGGEQQRADPAESGRDADADTETTAMEDSEVEELVEKRVEEQHEQTVEAATEAATEAASEAASEAVEKALSKNEDGGDPESAPNRNLTDDDLDALEKRLGSGDPDDPEEVEVSEERAKEIEAVVKGMERDGRKGRATQTDTRGGEPDGYSESFVADAMEGDD